MNNLNNKYLILASTLVDDELYSFTAIDHLPLIVNLKTEKICLLNDMENYDLSFVADSMWAIRDGDNIFVIELNGERLLQYNFKEKKCCYYKIECNGKQWDNCAALAKYKNKVYVFPKYKKGIIKIDIKSGKIEKNEEVYRIINSYKTKEKCKKENKYFQCGCQDGNILWLFQESGNLVVAYNIKNDSWREYELPIEINHCIHTIMHNGLMYILCSDGRIFLWDMKSDMIERIFEYSEEGEAIDIYSRIAVADKIIFMLPALGQDILKINVETKRVEKYTAYPEEFCYYNPENCSKYNGYCENDRFYYFSMRSANYILQIDKHDGREKWIKPQLPLVTEYMEVYMSYNEDVFIEGKWSKEELECILSIHTNKEAKKISTDGERIWNQTKIDNVV